jgi:hypothetical protein
MVASKSGAEPAVSLHRGKGRQFLRQHPPLASRLGDAAKPLPYPSQFLTAHDHAVNGLSAQAVLVVHVQPMGGLKNLEFS